jgi:hypothetical protein
VSGSHHSPSKTETPKGYTSQFRRQFVTEINFFFSGEGDPQRFTPVTELSQSLVSQRHEQTWTSSSVGNFPEPELGPNSSRHKSRALFQHPSRAAHDTHGYRSTGGR